MFVERMIFKSAAEIPATVAVYASYLSMAYDPYLSGEALKLRRDANTIDQTEIPCARGNHTSVERAPLLGLGSQHEDSRTTPNNGRQLVVVGVRLIPGTAAGAGL